MRFEWDREKNRVNQLNHGGIAFESVAQAQSLGGSGAVLWLADNVQCNPGSGSRVCVKLVRVQVDTTGTSVSATTTIATTRTRV